MKAKANLDAISIILVRTRFPENIGAVARIMKNMGLCRLILVDGCSPLQMNAYKLASGAEDILERAEEFPTLGEAISEMEFVAGMTSRGGKEREPFLTPEQLMKELVPLSAKNCAAIVFGSEREGLTNGELTLCHRFVKIPSTEAFPSLNLAQAVAVLCYELSKPSCPAPDHATPLARSNDLEEMFRHMEKTLIDIGFLERQNPGRIMRVLRKLFGRSRPEDREVRILQGIWSKIDWHLKKINRNNGMMEDWNNGKRQNNE